MENIKKENEGNLLSPLAEAKKVVEELKAANAKKEELLQKEAELRAASLINGRATANGDAGQAQKTEAEIKKEMTKAFWKGTQIEKALEKYG